MVELALKEEYSQIMIQETLQDFFQEIGKFINDYKCTTLFTIEWFH